MQYNFTTPLARLLPVFAALSLGACADQSQPFAPNLTTQSSNAVAKPGSAAITAIDFGPAPLVIDGKMQLVPVTVTNLSRTAIKDVAVLATVTQPDASRPVGWTPLGCPGSPPGVLPARATCIAYIAVTISNRVAGTGTLVPGPAEFTTRLRGGKTQSMLDSRTDAIELVQGGA